MAGSGKKKKKSDIKNIDMLTVRNKTKQEVTNVIFPNGLTVGLNDAKFSNGMKVHGDAQIGGIINARGYRINGTELTGTQGPPGEDGADGADGADGTNGTNGTNGINGTDAHVVRLSATSTVISYDSAGSNPNPGTIVITANSQNFTNGFFKFTGAGGAFSDEGSYTDGAAANVDTITFTSPTSYSSAPYTFVVGVAEGNQSEICADSITIGSIKPGLDGTSGTSPKSVRLTSTAHIISYDAAGSNPSPSSISLTANSQNFTNGFFKFTNSNTFFTDEASHTDGTAANQDTKNNVSMPGSYFSSPVTITVSVGEGEDSSQVTDAVTIVAVKPGQDGQDGSAALSDKSFTFSWATNAAESLPPDTVQLNPVTVLRMSNAAGDDAVNIANMNIGALQKIATFSSNGLVDSTAQLDNSNGTGITWTTTHEDSRGEFAFPGTMKKTTHDAVFTAANMVQAVFFVPKSNGTIKSLSGVATRNNSNTVSSGYAYFSAGLYTLSDNFTDGITATPAVTLVEKFVFGPLSGTDRGLNLSSSASVAMQLSGSAMGGNQFTSIVANQPYFILGWTTADNAGWGDIGSARGSGGILLSSELTCVYTET